MKNKTYILNTFLAAVFGIYMLVAVVVRAFCPQIILPKANIPNMVLISLIALVLDHYLAPDLHPCFLCCYLRPASLLCCFCCTDRGTEAGSCGCSCVQCNYLAVYHYSGAPVFRTRCKGFCLLQCGEPVYGIPVLCRNDPLIKKP